MHMQMKHRLARLGTAVDHGAPAAESLLLGHLDSHQQQMPQQRLVLWRRLGELGDRFPWNHQHMHRRLGRHIAEGQAEIIAVDRVTGNLAPQDAAEDRVTGHGLTDALGAANGTGGGTGVQ